MRNVDAVKKLYKSMTGKEMQKEPGTLSEAVVKLAEDYSEKNESNSKINENSKIFNSIICGGDSITAGVRKGFEDREKSYPNFLQKMMGCTVTNSSLGGYTTKDWWENKAKTHNYSDYDAVILKLGQNGGLTDTIDEDCVATESLGEVIPEYEVTEGSYINNNGAVANSSGFKRTSAIELKSGETIKITTKGYQTNVAVICTCDSNATNRVVKVISEDNTVKTYEYTATEDCYVCLSGNYTGDFTVKKVTYVLSYEGYADTQTGNYCKIIEYIKEQNEKIKIFLVPIKNYDNSGKNTNAIIKKIADKYGIVYLDIYSNPYCNLDDEKWHKSSTGESYNVHFNTIGYFNLAKVINYKICEHIENNINEYADL